MTNKDPYEILGVSRNATQDEIKRAYRRLAKQYHPDRNPGDKSAEQHFKEVHAAYEVLGDAQRRTQYDRFGAGGPTPEYQTWTEAHGAPFEDLHVDFGPMGDLSSIFEQFFSRGVGTKARRRTNERTRARGSDVEHEVEVAFEEAARGTTRDIVLTSAGSDRNEERIQVRIPAGIGDLQRIRVRGKGHAGLGGRGDLMIRIRIRPHPRFRREGLNILLDLPLSFAEAALGGSVEIPTLDGLTVVKVPPGTSSGTKLRLRGRGIRDERSGQTGDMYALVQVQVPKTLSPRARQLVQELADELRPPRERAGPA